MLFFHKFTIFLPIFVNLSALQPKDKRTHCATDSDACQ